jgi:hypothetical protein
MSCHVLTDDLLTSQAAEIRRKVEDVLQQRFHIEHTALQMECQECGANEIFCKLTLEEDGGNKTDGPPKSQPLAKER